MFSVNIKLSSPVTGREDTQGGWNVGLQLLL